MFDVFNHFFSNAGMLAFLMSFVAIFFGHFKPIMIVAAVFVLGYWTGYSEYESLVFIGMIGSACLIIEGISNLRYKHTLDKSGCEDDNCLEDSCENHV